VIVWRVDIHAGLEQLLEKKSPCPKSGQTFRHTLQAAFNRALKH